MLPATALPLPARALQYRLSLLATLDPIAWASYIESPPPPSCAGAHEAPADDAEVPQSPWVSEPTQGREKHCCADTSQRDSNIAALRGRIWRLSRDARGSRHVQKAFKTVTSSDFEELALEMRGHVLEAAKCRHANHVLQKCIDPKGPKASRAIAQELVGHGVRASLQIAKHVCGCRIVQRILQFGDAAETDVLSDFLLTDAKGLCTNRFGNYVMQHLVVHGSERHVHRLVDFLRSEAAELGADFHASGVIGVALQQEHRQDVMELASVLFWNPKLLNKMARTEHGRSAAKKVVHVFNSSRVSS